MLIKSLALSILVLAGLTADAHAIPLIAGAIAGALGLGALGTAIVTGLVTLVLGVGLQVLSSLLLRKKSSGDVGGTTGKLQTGGTVPRAFPIGTTIVSHSLVYANTFGQSGKTPNAYLVQVLALSDLPVDGLAEIWVNGSKVTWNPAATPATEGIAIPEFNKNSKDHLWIRFYDGSQTTADTRLVALFGTDPDRPYESTRVGTGVAYVVVTCRLERELFGGFPTFKFVLDGVPLYDPREDTSAGGSGSQDFDDPSTWSAAPANPMVAAYNVLRGISYDGDWFFGAQTVSAAQVPFAAWNAAMNECDVEIDLDGGGTEPQFAANGEIRLDMTPADVLDKLLTASNGRLGEIGGIYKPHVGAAGAAVMSLTDDDILSTEAQTFEPFKNLAEQVNGVTAKYIEPQEGWSAKDAPALYNATLEAEDGGRRQVADVPYDFVTSGTAVQRLMKAALNEHRRERGHTLPLPTDAFVLEPTVDFVSWTSTRNGYTNKLFRVDAVQDLDNLNVVVSLTEVDPSDYDWDETTDEQPLTISPTPQVLPPAQGIDDWDAEAVTLTTSSGLSKPAIRLLWDGDDIDDVIGVEFQVWDNGLTEIVYEGTTAPSTVPLGEVVISANLVSATTYKVRGRFVPGSGRSVTWSGYIAVTTPTILVPRNTLDPAFSDLMRRVNERLTSVEGWLEDIGSAVQALDSVQVTDNQATVDRIQRITARVGSTRATVTQVQTVNATLVNALAALGIDVEAALGSDSAAGFLRIAAEVDGGGALAALLLGVAATRDGVSKEAAMKMVVDGLNSLIQFRAGQTQFLDDSDDPFAIFDGATRTLFVERIASGSTSLYKEFTRAEPGSDGAVGSGTTASNAGNSYIDSSSLGTITIPENPDSIGDGATASDYCPVLVAVNATARNGSTGWGFGSANPMVVAFRVKFSDGTNTFYSKEGLIACASSWNGAPVYGFGGNPGSMTGITQIKAGTYSVYLQYRWGPRTANGMTATATEPAGLQLRIAAEIATLILKK